MRVTTRFVLLSTVLACVGARPDVASAQGRQRAAWVSLGVGLASNGVGLGIGGSYHAPPHLASIRLTSGSNWDLLGCESDDITEAALLYGRGAPSNRTWRSVAGGVGLVWHHRTRTNPGGFSCISENTGPALGLPLELNFAWSPVRALGLGVTAFGNLNPTSSFGGVLLSLSLGRLARP